MIYIIICWALMFVTPTVTLALLVERPLRFHSAPAVRPPPTLSASIQTNNYNCSIDDLPPHYTSQSVLEWLSKMSISYKLERNEDLLDVIIRESDYVDNNNISVPDQEAAASASTASSSPLLLQLARVCATSNLPIASHDFIRDKNNIAIYNYGNLAFLHGFGYEWEEFIQLPSSKCVETPGEVEERQRLLDAVLRQQPTHTKNGNDEEDASSKYDNLIRVRKDGRKIILRGVNLWNVYDNACFEGDQSRDVIRANIANGQMKAIGQAVWIRQVEYLD